MDPSNVIQDIEKKIISFSAELSSSDDVKSKSLYSIVINNFFIETLMILEQCKIIGGPLYEYKPIFQGETRNFVIRLIYLLRVKKFS